MAPEDLGARGGEAGRRTLGWTVSGMDCAGCARKIRGAVERLPGVDEARVSVMSRSLMVDLDPARTPPEKIEHEVGRLGYGIAAREAGAAATVPSEAEECGCCGHELDPGDGHAHPDDGAHGHGRGGPPCPRLRTRRPATGAGTRRRRAGSCC